MNMAGHLAGHEIVNDHESQTRGSHAACPSFPTSACFGQVAQRNRMYSKLQHTLCTPEWLIEGMRRD